MDFKKLLKENKLVALDRKANETTAWKDQFYKAYQEKDFVLAEKIYLEKYKAFTSKVSDVHAGYKEQRRQEKRVIVYIAVFFVVFVVVVYLMAK